MLRIFSTHVQFWVRSIRIKKDIPSIQKSKPQIEFDEDELTEMSQYKTNRKTRNFADITAEKIAEIKGFNQRKPKEEQNQSEVNQDENLLNQTFEKKVNRHQKQKLKTFKIYKEQLKKNQVQGVQTQEKILQDLSRVRLQMQYLPYEYMRRVQKVFHKYDQAQLRQIALHFSKLMRLRYTEQKIDYEQYADLQFEKLQEKIPKKDKIEPIYLIGKQSAFQQKPQSARRADDDPIQSQINYTQNVVVSYLLNRVPRTYAVAKRVISEVKGRYPSFKPISFLDFGSGLSSGSTAFIEMYGDTGKIYNVEPGSKMRKMGKYLTSYAGINHFQSLGELSSQIRQVDMVYCGYVLNQINPELVTIYLESLYAKTKTNGFLMLAEYGNPFGARLIHQSRKWALTKKSRIVAPCPHHQKCPLAKSKSWCHFDQPSGLYPRQAFGKLPHENQIKYQKYSYLIIQKLQTQQENKQAMLAQKELQPNVAAEWDRVIFPLMRKGKHFGISLCTRQGLFQTRTVAKSHGIQYKQGRKLKWGDLWRFGQRIPNKFRKQRRTGKRLW